MLTKKIVNQGNGNYILIPKNFLQQLGIETNDKVKLSLENNKIIIEKIEEEN